MYYCSVDITLLLLLFTCNICTYGAPWKNNSQPGPKCGYKSCHPVKDGYLNVHIIPHSHDDVGWLKTVDQYYYGTSSDIQVACVKSILDTVIFSLERDPNKRFIYVETAYFWKWWMEQLEITKNSVKNLVASGQLEFIGGAWSMNDEATTNYMSIIDQFSWGLRMLNDTFGECGRPHIGWQVDPFGHSRQMATLFTQFGYDGLFIARVDYEEKIQRLRNLSAEMIWQSSPNLGSSADIYTHILHDEYGPPPGFCMDISCDPSLIIVDDETSPEYNVKTTADKLIGFFKSQEKAYQPHGNIILTMGGDFTYQDASHYFKSLDKLIKHINSRQVSGSKINAIYSTPSCYLKAVNDKKITFPIKEDDDFFPYKNDEFSYWTGYFTSRPTLKYYERRGNNYLQTCKQLSVQSLMGFEYESKITPLREIMGVMQHHDAITGTEKQHVANDYARLLSKAIMDCEEASYTILSEISGNTNPSQFNTCQLLNISQCTLSERNEQFMLTLYNPLSRLVTEFVRLPIIDGNVYNVVDPNGRKLTMQIVPLPKSVLRIPGRNSSATAELVFQAKDLPPLGYKSYLITKEKRKRRRKRVKKSYKSQISDPVDIGNRLLGLKIDSHDPQRFILYVDNEVIPLTQEFLYYKSQVHNMRSSGAYIFRPNGPPIPVCNYQRKPQYYSGLIVQEIHLECNKWVSQVIRKYDGENHIEFEWLVGPLPNDHGTEVISRFWIPFYQSNKTFYTDSNGREMLKRVLNYRSSFELEESIEHVSGNYYPVTSRITLTDMRSKFSILNDRPQGGSSLRDGEIELMVHRRMFHDDGLGVIEALNEEPFNEGLVARGQHYLTFGSVETQPEIERLLAQRKLIRPQYFFTVMPNRVSYEELKKFNLLEYSGLAYSLPDNVQLLTLEPWKDGSVLIRFEHLFECNENILLSRPVILDVFDLFTKFRIISLKETTLDGNQWLTENTKLTWMAQEKEFHDREEPTSTDQIIIDPKNIMLNPMQIRTFVAEIIPNLE